MLTPTDLLAAGFRFFHPEHHGARPLYQRIVLGPEGEHLYHINVEDYEAALRSTGASAEVAASNRWSTKAHLYLDTDTFAAVAYSIRPTTTAAEIVAFYARAYAAIGCVPDPLN